MAGIFVRAGTFVYESHVRVAFEHVAKVYPGGTRPVDDFTLEIRDGEFVGEALLDWKPSALSGGQRQRWGGRSGREPSLFLMDEPLSNLGAKRRDDPA